MDEKLKKIIFIILGCFVILFLFLFLISSCSSKITPNTLERMMVEEAKNYYSYNKNELPSKGSVTTISIQDLVNKGIIKELDKLLKDGTACSGTLTIENNNDYYMYSPNLSCTMGTETYKTENLKDLLLENVTTSGNGLYNIGNDYYYRGDNLNNYVMFDGLLWRITKVNNDNTIRLIEAGRREPVVWDDRYNADMTASTGINNFYNNNINSRILDSLEEIYDNDIVLSSDAKGYIKETSLCIGKRSSAETINDGSIECSTTLDNQYLGLLQLNEYVIASLDSSCLETMSNACRNYNYLADFPNSYWTLTANSENTNQVYKVNTTIMSTTASNTGMNRLVINISENTNVTGNGTEEDPYVVSGFKNELKEID